MINRIISYIFLCICLNNLFSCNDDLYLGGEFDNTLVSSKDTVTISNIKCNSLNGRILDIKFVGEINSKFRLSFSIKGDSLFIKNSDNFYFFLRLKQGFTAEHLRIPDKFIPFGNIVKNVNYQNNSYVVKLDRAGPYTISVDPFIYEVTVKKNIGITGIKYFNGERNIVFTR